MPTTRHLYTLGEVKSILAKIHGMRKQAVEVHNNEKLQIIDLAEYTDAIEVKEDHFLFQVTME